MGTVWDVQNSCINRDYGDEERRKYVGSKSRLFEEENGAGE